MPISVEAIREAKDDSALFELLRSELDQKLPEGVREDWTAYSERLAQLPRGLRAMAGIFFFDVSMAMDDLAWHFGNQNDERELAETLDGLRELEMFEIADYCDKNVECVQIAHAGIAKRRLWRERVSRMAC